MEKKIQIITAIERDGFDMRLLTVLFEVLSADEHYDLLTAIKAAVTEWCCTEEGHGEFEYNRGCFNLADLVNSAIPTDLCRKHGFAIMDSAMSDKEIDWDEPLVDECEVEDHLESLEGKTDEE